MKNQFDDDFFKSARANFGKTAKTFGFWAFVLVLVNAVLSLAFLGVAAYLVVLVLRHFGVL